MLSWRYTFHYTEGSCVVYYSNDHRCVSSISTKRNTVSSSWYAMMYLVVMITSKGNKVITFCLPVGGRFLLFHLLFSIFCVPSPNPHHLIYVPHYPISSPSFFASPIISYHLMFPLFMILLLSFQIPLCSLAFQ